MRVTASAGVTRLAGRAGQMTVKFETAIMAIEFIHRKLMGSMSTSSFTPVAGFGAQPSQSRM
jgi:hypothetical protein